MNTHNSMSNTILSAELAKWGSEKMNMEEEIMKQGVAKVMIYNPRNNGILVEFEGNKPSCPKLGPSRMGKSWTIKEFSQKSRMNLIRFVAKTKFSKNCFTGVLPLKPETQPQEAKAALKRFLGRVRWRFKRCYGYWVLEWTPEEAIPHFHIVIDFNQPPEQDSVGDRVDFVLTCWEAEQVADEEPSEFSLVENIDAHTAYLAKEGIQKAIPDYVEKMTRFWGKFGKPKQMPVVVEQLASDEVLAKRNQLADILASNNVRPGYVEAVRKKATKVLLKKPLADAFMAVSSQHHKSVA